jgi:hypothetical protein
MPGGIRCMFVLSAAVVCLHCDGPTTAAPDGANPVTPDASPDGAVVVDAPPLAAKKLTFPGVAATGGIFDPSITRDPVTGTLWMSYSAVNASVMWPTQNKIAPHTRLASSSDGGETWTDAGPVNQISDVTLPLSPPFNAGTWMNEVSSLTYDPGAATNERWKLTWQTFIKINGEARFEHSWIALKMAATPQALALAPTTKWFASYLYDTGNNTAAAPTAPPVPTAPAIQADIAFPGLSTCIVGEPSLYATAAALYLALQCEQLNDPANPNDNDRLITLLRCASPCNATSAASWTFAGRVFSQASSAVVEPAFNGGYAAPALVETASGVFLLVTPTVNPDAIYRGCRAFKFANLDTATLETTAGVTAIKASVDGSTADRFNGACAYIGGAASGILQSELSQLPDGEFQIFMTRTAF